MRTATDAQAQALIDEGVRPRPFITRARLMRVRYGLMGLVPGLILGIWIGGGPNRYGEAEGVGGGLRGAYRTMARGCRYVAATARDCCAQDSSSVRSLGLSQQIETRLWQDKRLDADGIIVEVQDGGTAVLRGIVPDDDHKDQAVALARETRGVERVVDELAVPAPARTIETDPSAAVPTGVASGSRVVR